MANSKITALTAIAAVAGEDLVAIVDDPSVSPVSKKATITQLVTFLDSVAQTLTNKSIVASQLTGTIADAQMPDLTGDITTSAGAVATTIGADKVLLSMVAPAAKTEMIAIALGDEATVLAAASTSVPVVTYHMPYAFTLTNVKVGLTVAGTGAALVTIDVHEAGTTVLSTKVTVDATEKTSGTAATQPVVSDSALAVDSLIEIFVDVIDTDNVASGAKVYLIGYQS